jgi:integrase
LRKTVFGDVQRYLCRDCGFRFSLNVFNHFLKKGDVAFKGGSELPDSGFDSSDVQPVHFLSRKKPQDNPALVFGEDVGSHDSDPRFSTVGKSINSFVLNSREHRVSASTKKAKNLEEINTLMEKAQREGTAQTANIKGKIVEYSFWLLKQGYAKSTIEGRTKLLRILVKRGANLYDPESLKGIIAKQKWCNGRKNNACDAYSSFLKMVGGKWEAPVYKCIRKIPFIPKETEIDQLIAGCSKRMSTFLQTLKETGARCGEIWWLKWKDIDFESHIINITPEKNSNPRVIRASKKLLGMLSHLPRNYGDRVFSFPHMPVDHHARGFCLQRKRIANKTGNPRILRIHFHTFRHWKGTMLYHKTKDIYYVMQALGHKNIKNTLLYIQLEKALFQGEQDYISKVAKTEKDICALVEAGFEYVTEFQGATIFRKPKH